jgi:hypothetical protein
MTGLLYGVTANDPVKMESRCDSVCTAALAQRQNTLVRIAQHIPTITKDGNPEQGSLCEIMQIAMTQRSNTRAPANATKPARWYEFNLRVKSILASAVTPE